MNTTKHIILVGMKHSGKTTIGKQLASQSNSLFIDTDDLIKDLSGFSARELYDTGGVDAFKQKEAEACTYIAQNQESIYKNKKLIIATGGGLADNPQAITILKNIGVIILLDAPFETLFSRIMESAKRDGRLPTFLQGEDPEKLFLQLYQQRITVYNETSDYQIKTGDASPLKIATQILDYCTYE